MNPGILQTINFLKAIHVTRPEINFSDFRKLLLSQVEIELLTAIAQELLYLGNSDLCYVICTQISSYLSDTEMEYLRKDRFYAEYAIVYAKYLLEVKDYKEALTVADYSRHKMVENSEDSPLLELSFLTALGHYYSGNTDAAYTYFKNTFYTAHSIGSYYATICKNYVLSHNLFPLDEYLSSMKDIPYANFPIKETSDLSILSDGTYDIYSPGVLTIGSLIHELRTEQGITLAA